MKLFVGNLSFDATDNDLMDLFGTHGEIEDIYIAKDRDSGRPRGFAFVTFTDKEAAKAACKELDGADHMGRNLRVNEATPKPNPGGGGGGGGRRDFGRSRRNDRY